MVDTSQWNGALPTFAKWLDSRSPSTLRRWITRLESQDDAQSEGAIAEAVAWTYLNSRTASVDLAEHDSTGGVDFVFGKPPASFFVEVTNISRSIATKVTDLTDLPSGPQHYATLTSQIKREVIAKTSQGADLTRPFVIFVTTLHFQASALCVDRDHLEELLRGRAKIVGRFDPDKGQIEDDLWQEATMDLSAFTLANTVFAMRRNVSAVFVGGFGLVPPEANVFALLHPDPVRPFDPTWVTEIPCARFKRWPPEKIIEIEWVQSKDGSLSEFVVPG